ncbi:uncharacterized protein LOC141793185 [Halichoeres trimaculatus]|uniref:uncharacterized protein LOC141793185 n=1 Tax=Halichoeres trimaculatus TaxID=147232 RepID=UPI003D9FAB59
MDKFRKWFNKPKKEVENQLGVQPLTSERSHDSCHDDAGHIRTLSSDPQRTVAPGTDLRKALQEDFGQEQEVSFGVTNTAPASPRHFEHFFRTDSSSLPSSPHPGGSRLPCSLPCSPLLRGRHWRSSSSSSSSSSLSRLWVEEALQRSKNLRQNEPRSHLSYFKKVRPEGEWVTTEEESEQDGWCEGSEEDYKQVEAEDAVGTMPPDTVTFKAMTPSSLSVQESRDEDDVDGEDDDEEKDSWNLCLDLQTYCQLTPCVCDRCPSAPPFEPELVSGLQVFPLLSLEDLSHTLTRPQRTDIQRPKGDSEQSVPRDGSPQLGKSSCLYPSLRMITSVPQNRKQEQEVDSICSQLDNKPNKTCYHGDNTDNKLLWLSDAAGELQTFCCEDLRLIPKMLIDCSTCIQRTVFSVECCSFCSNKLRNTKQLCTTCKQVHTHLYLD